MVSSLLLLIGIAALVRCRFMANTPLEYHAGNVSLILASLAGFALISSYVNMTVGIAFMVFCSGLAAKPYSVVRNLKVAAGLIAVAFVFQKFLGLNLPLY
jgi:hypothetical protein